MGQLLWQGFVQYVLPILVFGAITGTLNAIFRWKTPEAWEAFAARNKAGALLVNGLRAVGWDMPKLIRAIQRYFKGRLDLAMSVPPSEVIREVVVRDRRVPAEPSGRAEAPAGVEQRADDTK
jgi:hypothetical protein